MSLWGGVDKGCKTKGPEGTYGIYTIQRTGFRMALVSDSVSALSMQMLPYDLYVGKEEGLSL